MIVFFKRFFSSKFGWTAVAIHFIAVIYAFWGLASFEGGCGPFPVGAGSGGLAGRYIHLVYEPLFMQILLVLDLLAIGLAELIVNLIGGLSWCYIPRTWAIAILSLFFASLQWYVIGWMIQRMFEELKTTPGQVD